LLIASNPLRLISSESSSSHTLSVTSSTSSTSSTLVNSTSSETNVSDDIFDNENLVELDMFEEIRTLTQQPV
jgi:hypothetical protein